ncbi:MAG: hypothetical protein FWE27_07040 [Defluviitaleaceae bacterium]|nr:hypothetical protein [Defluviitaleaceae bacterium]
MKNETVLDKCKTVSRNAFIKIGNSAAGNTSNDSKRGNIPIEPFSIPWVWPYEKKAPKRKGK